MGRDRLREASDEDVEYDGAQAAERGLRAQHAKEEVQHLDLLCERINQLGGKPRLNPAQVTARAASKYVEGETLIDMIRENLIAEYRDMVHYFADKDPSTRILLERILAQEEEHANDMHDILVRHEVRPTLRR